MFRGYAKMADTSSRFGSVNGQFCVTEKVHGAHFCVIVGTNEGASAKFAKRGEMLAPGDNFYGYLDSEVPGMCSHVAPVVVRQVAHMAEAERLYGYRFEDIERIRIHGELYGGKYPGKESPSSVRGPVQNGVWYSEKLEFIAYDIALEVKGKGKAERDGGRGIQTTDRYLNFQDFREVCELSGLPFLDALFLGLFAECVGFNIEFLSTVPAKLGLPPLPDNLAEGVVIKACEEREDGGMRRIMKSKIARFGEKSYTMSRQEWMEGVQKKKEDKKSAGFQAPGTATYEAVLYEALACVTATRHSAVLSKLGPDTPQHVVLEAYVIDVLQDLAEEDRSTFDTFDQAAKQEMSEAIRDAVLEILPPTQAA